MRQKITDFVLRGAEVPETALDFAATLFIDTIGVAAGAAPLEAGRIARDHAARFMAGGSAEDSAPMLFDGRQVSLTGAAFALASQIDNLDAHDGYNPTKGHIGCAVVPALCAFAEAMPRLSCRDAMTALVIAYEVAARAGIALHATVSDYHTSGAWNALGVAALGARLRGADAETLWQALGIAEYHGPRSQMMREIATPTMLHDGSGMGAMVGAMAVLLAEEGFTGAPAITLRDVPEHWADLGTLWTVERNYIKPYPICRWAHAPIDGLRALVLAHGFAADAVERIEVKTFAQAASLFADMPQTTSQAQYSLPFALAAWLVHGKLGPEQISGAGLSDPKVAEMLPRITVRAVDKYSERFPKDRCSDVTVSLRDGGQHASGTIHARGGPEVPMPLSEVEAKFHVMAANLPDPRRNAIWRARDILCHSDRPFVEVLALLTGALEG